MINEISLILEKFRICFSRKAVFKWFVIIIMGFILRLDRHGISSIIRWLALKPSLYTALLSFFKASFWQLKNILHQWWRIVISRCPLITVDNRYLIAGEGIKISKEAKKMPGVKRLHQESANSGKAPYIYGHHFGALGILAGWVKKIFYVPLCAELYEGVEKLRHLQNKDEPVVKGKAKLSITTLMATMVADFVAHLGSKCIVVLDDYFAVGPVFLVLGQVVDDNRDRLVHIITRAKSNVVAYEDPPPKTGRRGAPRKYGAKLN